MVIALAGALIGAALAPFTVLALIPAMAAGVIIVLLSATVGSAGFGAALSDLAGLLAAMQIGYVTGAALRLLMPRIVRRQGAPLRGL